MSGFGACGFLDALGTQDMLAAESFAAPDLFKKAVALQALQHDSLLTAVKLAREQFSEMKYLNAHAFSDSTFVIGLSGEEEETVFAHARAISAVARLAAFRQSLYFRVGRLCRGGIATGYVHVKKSSVLGSPISRAVGLENQVARGPYIVLSEAAEMFVRNLYYSAEDKVCGEAAVTLDSLRERKTFLYDAAGRMLVNPYTSLIPSSDEPPNEDQLAILTAAYMTIRVGLDENELRPHVYEKYACARDLHNSNVLRHPALGDLILPVQAGQTGNRFSVIEAYLHDRGESVIPRSL